MGLRCKKGWELLVQILWLISSTGIWIDYYETFRYLCFDQPLFNQIFMWNADSLIFFRYVLPILDELGPCDVITIMGNQNSRFEDESWTNFSFFSILSISEISELGQYKICISLSSFLSFDPSLIRTSHGCHRHGPKNRTSDKSD